MANNNGLNVLDAITAAKLGKGTGGSGGVTKKYVDDGLALKQDKTMSASVTIGAETETTVEGAIGELADLVPSTAAPATNKLATAGDVSGEEITVTASTSPVSTASGNLRKIAIFGKSEVVDGSIVSAGEGWATVDLGDLIWTLDGTRFRSDSLSSQIKYVSAWNGAYSINPKYEIGAVSAGGSDDKRLGIYEAIIYIRDLSYTDAAAFKTAMSGVILAYQLADPTQGNCIAVKTDDGTGIDGTMATFETGTPLRGIPDTDVSDVMEWNGSAGTVTKSCGEVDLGTLEWNISSGLFYAPVPQIETKTDSSITVSVLCSKYNYNSGGFSQLQDKQITSQWIALNTGGVYVKDTDYASASDFKTAVTGVKLVYPLATPTTTPLTDAEISAFRGLKTYDSTTNITITDNPEFEVEAYAGTANGRAINSLNENLNNKIDDKITVSSTLTLAANAWSNNTQTVTFAHDTTKRNVIDITPSEVPAWAAAGVYASAETSTGITFTCATVPETALTFKVTSMEVS